MRPEPRSEKRPEALHRIDVNFADAVAVSITSVFSLAVIDRLVALAPFGQTTVNVVFIGHHLRPRQDRFGDDGLDRLLLNIWQHPENNFTVPLDHPEHGRFLFLKSAPSPGAFQPAAASSSSFFFTASGCPLCPATM